MSHRNERVFILVLNWNNAPDTLECLASLTHLNGVPYTTIVIDNGSSDDSVSRIRAQWPHGILLETGCNLGYAGGNNVGIRYALMHGATHILLLNNDTIVDPGLLQAFLAGQAEILGAKVYLHSDPHRLDHLGGRWDPKRAVFDLVGKGQLEDGVRYESPIELDYACGACLFIHKRVFETIGLLEPRFFLFWEEADFCLRAKRAGLRTQLCPQAKVRHKGSASLTKDKPLTTYFWWRGRLLWIHKHCTRREKLRLYLRIVLPEATKALRRLWLHPPANRLVPRAVWQAMIDFFLSRFGPAPSWLLAATKKQQPDISK